MRIKRMNLPENLSLPALADVLVDLGTPIDRGNCGRALQAVAIPGVAAPDGPGGRWRIPRAKLTDAVAACLYRRQRRSHDRWAADLERCRWRAAELMLDHDELWKFVPRPLAEAIIERRREKWRLHVEAERRKEKERARQAREAKKRRLEHERRERERHEKVVLDWCYCICREAAREAIGLGNGPDDKTRPEIVQLYEDFPIPRPDWWLPPPELRARMAEYLKDLANIPDEHPDWNQWIPPHEPGKPWPWRRTDTERPEDVAGARPG
jgi:hypothetical protein